MELGEYWYRINVTSVDGLCPMSVAVEVAAVVSALMNTSGGVLAVWIGATARRHNVSVDGFGRKLAKLITDTGLMSKGVFASFVKQRPMEERHTVYFFVSKATHLVTLNSNAFYYDEREVVPLTDFDSICTLLRSCWCTGDDICDNHKGGRRPSTVESALSMKPQLAFDEPFPCPKESTHVYMYRAFARNGRSLIDTLKTESVKHEIRELVSALANTAGGSLLLGVTDTDVPIVKGYPLDERTRWDLDEALSEVLGGKSTFSGVSKEKKPWRVYFHPVSCNEASLSIIVEIHSIKYPGGMFYSTPLCVEVSETGDILPLEQFEEWKRKMLEDYKTEPTKTEGTFEQHFESDHSGDRDVPLETLTQLSQERERDER